MGEYCKVAFADVRYLSVEEIRRPTLSAFSTYQRSTLRWDIEYDAESDLGVVIPPWSKSILPPTFLSLTVGEDDCYVGMTIAVPRGHFDDDDFADYIDRLASIYGLELKEYTLEGYDCFVDADFYTRPDITIEKLAAIESDMSCAYINRISTDRPEVHFADILRSGIRAAIGAIESETFEVKRSHYPKDERGRLEIAKDVAAFANSHRGGVIVIGASTSRDSVNRDIVTQAHSLESDPGATSRYMDSLNKLIYPEVRGVEMSYVDSGHDLLFAILIPPQEKKDMPFIVRGGITSSDRISSGMFQVPIRKGDSNTSKRIEEVHSFLSRRVHDDICNPIAAEMLNHDRTIDI
ncbi:Putative DNA-binding domain-containing protein [Nocardia amikacinitolerans]|uniref:Putative DNA-binding domain-containing protein n=1 Tax=Nocardia amikacinitolerans TaxID=756689 RepID=A0A285LW51_9NOCA|nr:ATP-binding protein [Nocardia amikacinitolerans]SNY88683.1 Putative DNA-binding domain-containing protein [Nocardia amikacinitolerans]